MNDYVGISVLAVGIFLTIFIVAYDAYYHPVCGCPVGIPCNCWNYLIFPQLRTLFVFYIGIFISMVGIGLLAIPRIQEIRS